MTRWLFLVPAFAAVLAASSPAHAQAPRQGGVLNLMQREELPQGLSIHETSTIATIWPASPCFNNLVYFDPMKPAETMDTVVGELAEKWSWQDNYRNLAGAIDAKHLLTGFVRCGTCGGSIVQSWVGQKPVYRCWYSWSRGRTVCTNTLTVRQELADLAVLRAVERDVLDADVVNAALTLALTELGNSRSDGDVRRDELRIELARIETELTRYSEAIAATGPLDTILHSIKTRETRRAAIRAELKTTAARQSAHFDASKARATLREYLAEWRAMARGEVAEARRLLREVLLDRIVFRPVPRPADMPPAKGPGRKASQIYEFSGEASLSNLFAGLISVSSVVAPTGFEPVFQP